MTNQTTIARQNVNVMGNTNYSRKDSQIITEDCDSWLETKGRKIELLFQRVEL